ncbi:TRAP transporter substrate-binding protein [Sedimenticola selenatireducens]|uniref:C4-dicarboxylate ABC transporter substrate-binding protein n=1 Tax=Sedimenticola selenatireducens TaxID=191960 RepID=A0A2N6CWE2_9GAMM|nr:TRAP transporter substrate-binding protein [Sedimenticola selenatireducens]PLX61575.1 MAG: C4-dicarboxylate ABC transporter substrate-binding protein [Sedimenticola selenatireducens]
MNKLKNTLLTACLLTFAQGAHAAEVNLRFAHFWPAQSAIGKHWQAWAKSVEAASNNRIAVEVYPSQTLAKAPKIYDAVISGIADIGVTAQGYTANRFPLTQIVELPGQTKSSTHGSCLVQTLLADGAINQEYDESHPLFVFTTGPNYLHSKGKAVRTPDDLKGLRIRRPTAVVSELLADAGSQPVGMPAPQTYQSMSRGVIDGGILSWEGAKAFRLNDLADHHTEFNFNTLSLVMTMNKQTYNDLPDDLRQVIDNHAGLTWSIKSGEVMDAEDTVGREQAVAQNQTIITIENGINNPQWKEFVDRATNNYLDQVGGPARNVYLQMQKLSNSCKI